jgi:UDP-glucuronate 4-epimerase
MHRLELALHLPVARRRDLGFEPKTSIEEGLPRFVARYRAYHGI